MYVVVSSTTILVPLSAFLMVRVFLSLRFFRACLSGGERFGVGLVVFSKESSVLVFRT